MMLLTENNGWKQYSYTWDWENSKGIDLKRRCLNWYDWYSIKKYHPSQRHALDTYKIQTVEIEGTLSSIIDLFVRINSTGKRLTSGEKRHARFYDSVFLREADKLVAKFRKFLIDQKILSNSQIERMKGTELISELLMSIHNGGPINKKIALDRAIGNESINLNTLHRISREFISTITIIKKMFPLLKQTRFHNSVEFYSLFLLIWEMKQNGLVLINRSRNRIAFALLKKLSTGVDQLRDLLKHAKIGKTARLYSDYLLTVQGDTDSSATRERRREILKSLLYSLFERKDSKRGFTPEQRRILWNSEEKHYCPKCKELLTWEDFTIDHITAHSRGGKSNLKNARIMCRNCNSSKYNN